MCCLSAVAEGGGRDVARVTAGVGAFMRAYITGVSKEPSVSRVVIGKSECN